MTPQQLASLIDHTLLKPQATHTEVRHLCMEAAEFGFAAVCVNPGFVPLVADMLRGSPVKTCSVAGFPLGATYSTIKAQEAAQAITDGAAEIDMVINLGALIGGQLHVVEQDIRAVARVCHGAGALCKVIVETAALNEHQKADACKVAIEAGADFLKTSTGFGPGGATVEDVRLLAGFAKPAGKGVKASGGIRTLADAMRMIEAGATRIGASSGVAILREAASSQRDGA